MELVSIAVAVGVHLVLLLVIVEAVLVGVQPAWYCQFRAKEDPSIDLPSFDASGLGQGVSGALKYRWDASRSLLLFGRRPLHMENGYRGQLVGFVRFDGTGKPTVSWHYSPLFLVAGLVFAAPVVVAFALLVGPMKSAIGGLLLPFVAGAFHWILGHNARLLLADKLVPELRALFTPSTGPEA